MLKRNALLCKVGLKAIIALSFRHLWTVDLHLWINVLNFHINVDLFIFYLWIVYVILLLLYFGNATSTEREFLVRATCVTSQSGRTNCAILFLVGSTFNLSSPPSQVCQSLSDLANSLRANSLIVWLILLLFIIIFLHLCKLKCSLKNKTLSNFVEYHMLLYSVNCNNRLGRCNTTVLSKYCSYSTAILWVYPTGFISKAEREILVLGGYVGRVWEWWN